MTNIIDTNQQITNNNKETKKNHKEASIVRTNEHSLTHPQPHTTNGPQKGILKTTDHNHTTTNHNKHVKFAQTRRTKRQPKRNKNTQIKLKLMYANANGICSKTNSLTQITKTAKPHIFAITETKIEGKPPIIEDYEWITKDREGRKGGGVALLIRKDIINNTIKIDNLEDHDMEILWIKIKSKNNNIAIGTYYGPQENAPREEIRRQYAQLTNQITKLQQNHSVILAGDFNAKISITKPNITQTTSPNGKELEKLLTTTKMNPISTNAINGTWTRVNRNNTQEKSIIDYILISNELTKKTNEVYVDEEGIYRLEGTKPSDHNTIRITTEINQQYKHDTREIWKINNQEGWKMYNEQLITIDPKQKYKTIENKIKDTLTKTIGKQKITISKHKPRESTETKILRANKKEKRKLYNNACKQKDNIKQTLQNYLKAQMDLKENIIGEIKHNTEQKIKQLIAEGGTKSNNFWKIRKKLLNNKAHEEYDTVTEENTIIENPEESKEHIANYFENLYQAREGEKKYEEWTTTIKNTQYKP